MALSSNEAKCRTLETVRKQQRLWDMRMIQHHFLPQRAVIYQAIYYFSLQQSIFMHIKPRRLSRTRFYKQLITGNIGRYVHDASGKCKLLRTRALIKSNKIGFKLFGCCIYLLQKMKLFCIHLPSWRQKHLIVVGFHTVKVLQKYCKIILHPSKT